jgi:hypothetical protein
MAGTREWRLSYRWRRRAVVVAVVGAVAVGVAAAVILLPTAEKTDTKARPVSGHGAAAAAAAAAQPERPAKEPPERRPSRAEQKQILSTISLFVSTSVARHHPERSFEIVDSSLREGMTKKQWSKGTIPVVPYPAVGIDLIRFELFRGNKALIEVLLEPAKGSRLVRKTFQIELHRSPSHEWLVSSWVPEGVSQNQIDLNRPQSPDVIAKAANPPHLSAKWIYVPLGILLVGLLATPVALLGHHAYASRRASKRYRESLPPDDARRYEPWR